MLKLKKKIKKYKNKWKINKRSSNEVCKRRKCVTTKNQKKNTTQILFYVFSNSNVLYVCMERRKSNMHWKIIQKTKEAPTVLLICILSCNMGVCIMYIICMHIIFRHC